MQTTELKVDGMTCGSCVASVTKALKRVPGVQDVEVDLVSGSGVAAMTSRARTPCVDNQRVASLQADERTTSG